MTTEAIADRIREAARAEVALRIAAGGNWLSAGHPVTAPTTLSLAADRGIVEYVPGDLTLTARAGTPIAELFAAVKANDQWLPLDPWGSDGGTLGATLSTATAGPHSHAMGLPRDVALGVEFVSGTGEVIRAGGRVVKNVAGFDLTRLVIGAWGTLGVITEVTLRLRARPAVLRTLLLGVETQARTLNSWAVDLRRLPFTPIASELVNGELARRLDLGGRPTCIIRIAGNANSVNAQLAALRRLGPISDAPDGVWQRLRECDRGAQATWRHSQAPSAFGDTWNGVEKATSEVDGALLHGNPLRGVVRAAARGDVGALRRAVQAAVGTRAIEMLPADAFALHDDPVRMSTARLEGRIRKTFDPKGILNPGIMGRDT